MLQTPRPSVIDAPNFDAEKDAQALRDAMKGAGTDEEEIISIVCARSHQQLVTLDKTYKQMFGRILIDDLKSELSGSFEKVILRLFLSDAEKDAHTLKQAVKVSTLVTVKKVRFLVEKFSILQNSYKYVYEIL